MLVGKRRALLASWAIVGALGALLAACAPAGDEVAPPVRAVVEPASEAAAPPPLAPFEGALRRLTAAEYRACVRDLLGADVPLPERLEPDRDAGGLVSVGAALGSVSPTGVERYEDAAFALAASAMAAPARLSPFLDCDVAPDGALDGTCLRAFAAAFGGRAWRRPLTNDEVDRLARLGEAAANALDDPDEALRHVVAASLQAPAFLYRDERAASEGTGGAPELGPWALAARLSFFLRAAPPDEALRRDARNGRLRHPAILRAHAERMLAAPEARAAWRAFVDDWFGLEGLESLSKDPGVFPDFAPDLASAARFETLGVAEAHVFDDDADWRAIFTRTETLADRRLAALYGLPAPSLDGFAPLSLPADGPRAGLLGHASFLMLRAHPVSTSATLRGKAIRQALLCGDIPPPPADVDTGLPEPSASAPTLKERAAVHLTEPSCAACHGLMDPIGLGLERFDGVGRFRAAEHGAPIDPSGDVDGVPYADARDLGRALAEHPDLLPCLVRHLLRHATGRLEGPGQGAAVADLTARLEAHGGRVQPLLVELVAHPIFRRASVAP